MKTARDAGRTDAAVTAAQDFQRRTQFYVDFIESENSNGFHASQEAARILGESINFSRKARSRFVVTFSRVLLRASRFELRSLGARSEFKL
ncbi:MAG TPA: ammonia-forming cytochrome c nitrite reductase subunit c552 [Pyrinomonadaceae bacterium]|nr:ammonia-forming cytochrome c nitrite reductase subunit c552 [Pyrinomonadaceae bacterium]